jgi:hypothetical protein
MVAAVATDDPLMAAKPPQAAMVAMASPPRRCPIQVCAARNSSPLMPEAVANAPIRMNIGIRPKECVVAARSVASDSWRNAGSTPTTNPKPHTPTVAMAMPIGTRSAISTNRTTNPPIAIASCSTAAAPPSRYSRRVSTR